ncbi:MAG: hypothetical protein EOP24_37790 [Hyphomicrobiales bacterium]|nr:MAG: hypothetical protein EOP24_37790 [Hyphomicrobiales bacterium]
MSTQPRCGEKAVRLVLEHCDEYPSEYEAIRTIAERMSLKAETVRVWVRKAEAAGGGTPAASASEAETELRALRRKNAELETTVEILKAPKSFFARECDPPRK